MLSPPPLWSLHSTRLKIALFLCLAIYSTVSMRTSLSMGIVCMVNSTAFEEYTEIAANISYAPLEGCPAEQGNSSITAGGYDGTLLWSPSRQSTLFSASYYGSLITMLLSGPMADKYGPKRILAGAISLLVVMTIAAPSLARFDYWTFYASRVIMGMGEGFVFPSANAMGVRWFPPSEKSTMNALYTSGIQIAAASSNLIGSFLCGVSMMGGWPLIFYLFGIQNPACLNANESASIGICWLVPWLLFVTDHPSQNKFVGVEERMFLEQHVVKKKTSKIYIPWRKLLTSRQVYACLFCDFTASFLIAICQNFLPLYFKEELRLPISMNGFFTVVPFLTQFIGKNSLARIADHLKSSGKLSPTTVVKLFQAIASFGTCLSILCLALLPSCHRPWVAVVAMVAYGIAFSGSTSGFVTSLLSIAPAYTGTLVSLSMACGQLSSVLAAYFVGVVTEFGWPHKWLIIFSIGSVMQLFSGTFFLLFGSGEQADWTKIRSTHEEKPLNDGILENVQLQRISNVA